jgi:hypothetical protein
MAPAAGDSGGFEAIDYAAGASRKPAWRRAVASPP